MDSQGSHYSKSACSQTLWQRGSFCSPRSSSFQKLHKPASAVIPDFSRRLQSRQFSSPAKNPASMPKNELVWYWHSEKERSKWRKQSKASSPTNRMTSNFQKRTEKSKFCPTDPYESKGRQEKECEQSEWTSPVSLRFPCLEETVLTYVVPALPGRTNIIPSYYNEKSLHSYRGCNDCSNRDNTRSSSSTYICDYSCTLSEFQEERFPTLTCVDSVVTERRIPSFMQTSAPNNAEKSLESRDWHEVLLSGDGKVARSDPECGGGTTSVTEQQTTSEIISGRFEEEAGRSSHRSGGDKDRSNLENSPFCTYKDVTAPESLTMGSEVKQNGATDDVGRPKRYDKMCMTTETSLQGKGRISVGVCTSSSDRFVNNMVTVGTLCDEKEMQTFDEINLKNTVGTSTDEMSEEDTKLRMTSVGVGTHRTRKIDSLLNNPVSTNTGNGFASTTDSSTQTDDTLGQSQNKTHLTFKYGSVESLRDSLLRTRSLQQKYKVNKRTQTQEAKNQEEATKSLLATLINWFSATYQKVATHLNELEKQAETDRIRETISQLTEGGESTDLLKLALTFKETSDNPPTSAGEEEGSSNGSGSHLDDAKKLSHILESEPMCEFSLPLDEGSLPVRITLTSSLQHLLKDDLDVCAEFREHIRNETLVLARQLNSMKSDLDTQQDPEKDLFPKQIPNKMCRDVVVMRVEVPQIPQNIAKVNSDWNSGDRPKNSCKVAKEKSNEVLQPLQGKLAPDVAADNLSFSLADSRRRQIRSRVCTKDIPSAEECHVRKPRLPERVLPSTDLCIVLKEDFYRLKAVTQDSYAFAAKPDRNGASRDGCRSLGCIRMTDNISQRKRVMVRSSKSC